MTPKFSALLLIALLIPVVTATSTPHLLWKYSDEETNSGFGIRIDREGEHILASSSKFIEPGNFTGYVYFFDRDGRLYWKHPTEGIVTSLSISGDGRFGVAGSFDKNLYFFGREEGLLWRFTAPSYIKGAAISADGEYVAAASKDETVFYFNQAGDLLWKYSLGVSGHSIMCCGGVAISEHGDYIAVGSWGNLFYLLNSTGNLLWEQEPEREVNGIAISSDGDLVVAASDDGTVYFVNRSRDILAKHKLPPAFFVQISTSSDLSVVGAASGPHLVVFSNFTPVFNYSMPERHPFREFFISSIDVSPDGEYILIGRNTKNEGFILFSKEGKIIWKMDANRQVGSTALSEHAEFIVASDSKLMFFNNSNGINRPESWFQMGLPEFFGGRFAIFILLLAIILSIHRVPIDRWHLISPIMGGAASFLSTSFGNILGGELFMLIVSFWSLALSSALYSYGFSRRMNPDQRIVNTSLFITGFTIALLPRIPPMSYLYYFMMMPMGIVFLLAVFTPMIFSALSITTGLNDPKKRLISTTLIIALLVWPFL